VGDVVDCWRVETLEPARRIRFLAEMKLPGRAWLEFEFEEANGRTAITQTAVFDPLGLGGLAYWYVLYPAHRIIFAGMLRRISRLAESSKRHAAPVATGRGV